MQIPKNFEGNFFEYKNYYHSATNTNKYLAKAVAISELSLF